MASVTGQGKNGVLELRDWCKETIGRQPLPLRECTHHRQYELFPKSGKNSRVSSGTGRKAEEGKFILLEGNQLCQLPEIQVDVHRVCELTQKYYHEEFYAHPIWGVRPESAEEHTSFMKEVKQCITPRAVSANGPLIPRGLNMRRVSTDQRRPREQVKKVLKRGLESSGGLSSQTRMQLATLYPSLVKDMSMRNLSQLAEEKTEEVSNGLEGNAGSGSKVEGGKNVLLAPVLVPGDEDPLNPAFLAKWKDELFPSMPATASCTTMRSSLSRLEGPGVVGGKKQVRLQEQEKSKIHLAVSMSHLKSQTLKLSKDAGSTYASKGALSRKQRMASIPKMVPSLVGSAIPQQLHHGRRGGITAGGASTLNQSTTSNLAVSQSGASLNASSGHHSPNISVLQEKVIAILQKELGSRTEKEKQTLLDYLRYLPSCKCFPMVAMKVIAESATQISSGPRVLVRKGTPVEHWYLIIKGKVGFYLDEEDENTKFVECEDGDHFGGSLIAEETPGVINANVLMHTDFLVIDKEGFQKAIREVMLTGPMGSIICILNKPPYERSSSELKYLFASIRNLSCFQHLSQFVVSELCRAMRHIFMEQGKMVFRQDSKGTTWYVILNGNTDILVQKGGEGGKRVRVAQCKSGNHFGEMALVNDAPRSATVMTTAPTDFLTVEKEDYIRVMSSNREKEILMYINFLRRVPIFENWKRPALYNIASFMRGTVYSPGAIIQREDDTQEDLCFVKRGVCQVYRKVLLPDRNTEDVLVGTFEQYQYFGEHSVLGGPVEVEGKKVNCQLTVVAGKEQPVTIVHIATLDAQIKFRTILSLSPLYQLSNDDLLVLRKQAQRRSKWEVTKRNHINLWLQEKMRDPKLTYEDYFGEKDKLAQWRY